MRDQAILADLIQSKNWKRAERLLRRAVKASDASAKDFYNLAKVLMEQRNTRQAMHWFRAALRKAPDHTAAWFELGRCALDGLDLDLAAECFRKSSQLDPDDLDAKRNLGRIVLRRGEWADAIEVWSQFSGDDREAACALFRARSELGQADFDDTRELVARHPTPEALAAIGRSGRGKLPFVLTPGGD